MTIDNTEQNQLDNAFFRDTQRMLACLDHLNKHERATVVITACIDYGMDSGRRIVGALRTLGFTPRHAGMTLSQGTGPDPARHHWYHDAAGAYRNHATRPIDGPVPVPASHIPVPPSR